MMTKIFVWRCRLETAATKDEGLEKFTSVKPDLAILDVMMVSWQDGFELARELKKDPDLKNVPILMLTGVENKTGFEFKSAAGDEEWLPVEGFLDKPVEPEVLLAEVEKLLNK
ncbi:MAG: response regulator [Planctomycetota bacterium]|jgi:CheY-like chemotaxis protein